MNTFLELVKQRQSARTYDATRSVEKEKIDRILEAVRLAPSAYNSQPWHFIVVDNEILKNKIADTTSTMMLDKFHFTKKAPVHVVLVEERSKVLSMISGFIRHKHFPHVDLGFAAAHFILAAADEGLSSSVITWFNESKVKKILGLPRSKKALLIITLGYSDEIIRDKNRKSMSQIVSYNKY